MEITIENLSDQELELYAHVCALSGTIDEKHAKLESDGTYEKYRAIHANYFDLFSSTNSEEEKLEILKRLIFLNWYSFTEPSFFTGIENLDNTVVFKSYSILNDYLKALIIDRELKWMISYYCMFEWVILAFSEKELNTLTKFVKAVDPSKNYLPSHAKLKETMHNRGQMCIYWLSISNKA